MPLTKIKVETATRFISQYKQQKAAHKLRVANRVTKPTVDKTGKPPLSTLTPMDEKERQLREKLRDELSRDKHDFTLGRDEQSCVGEVYRGDDDEDVDNFEKAFEDD